MGVTSPLSTGGAGTTYEQHVGAMFLALLLTHGIPAVFRDCQVDKVSFQTKQQGWETDDLLITCSSPHKRRRLVMQIRRSFTVGKSDECKETIQRFWKDFGAQDRFDPDKDALVLATLHHTSNLGGLASLLECARGSPGPGDFKDRLEAQGFVSDAAKRCHQEIHSIIYDMDPSATISEEMFWRFLKTIHVLFLDFTTDTAQNEATATQWLAISSGDADTVDAAKVTWHELVAVAADAASNARTFHRHDLPDDMRERYRAIPTSTIQPLTDHSATILNGIRSTIGGTTTLPRTKATTKAAMALGERVVALTGPPGAGKSALAKAIMEQHSGNHMCLSFRATEFAKSHIDDVLPGSISGERFRLFVGAQERVLIYVDGLEHLLECSVRNAFSDLVAIVESCPNVSLMLTCRDNEAEKAISALFHQSPLICHKVVVPPLNVGEMKLIRKETPVLETLLSRPELAHIMNTPYILDMAARMDWSGRQDIPTGIITFRKKWWKDIVRNDGDTTDGLPSRREQTLIDIAVCRARELRPSVPTDNMDKAALDKLHRDGIVVVDDDGLAAPAHDIIEDRAIIRWIEYTAARHEWAALPIADDIKTHPAIRRGFREWLKEGLDANSKEADRFVLSSYNDDSLPEHFRDDIQVSLLTSKSVRKFVALHKDRILADDARLLVKMIRLTRVACTKAPDYDRTSPQSVPMIPDGQAWPVLLEVVSDSLDSLLPVHAVPILGLLEDWARGAKDSSMPEGAVPAVRTAHRLLTLPWRHRDNGARERIFGIIASVPKADGESFVRLVRRASSEWNNLNLNEFRRILTGPDGIPACRDHPDMMVEFVMSLCLGSERDRGAHEMGACFYPESKFGLSIAARTDFHHFSAFCGPFLGLLIHHWQVGLGLILDLINHAGNAYGNRHENHVECIAISVPGHGKVRQWADDRLWQAYRGTSDVPHILMCALMALEYWLLSLCKGRHHVEHTLLDILRGSNNVMATGAVASVCAAYPDMGGKATLALLDSKRYIKLDMVRREMEGREPAPGFVAAKWQERYFDDERKESDALPHRRDDLGSLAHNLRPREGESPDGESASFDADKTESQQDRGVLEAESWWAGTFALYNWGLERWRRDSDECNAEAWWQVLYMAWDSEPAVIPERVHFTGNGPPVVAAVCVRDRWGEMSADEHQWCADALVAEVERYSDGTFPLSSSWDSDSIAARSLPKILANDLNDVKILEAVAKSFAHASLDVRLNSAKGVGEHLGPQHPNLVMQCVGAVLSNPLGGSGRHRSRKGRLSAPDAPEGTPELIRRAFADQSIDVETELGRLDLASQPGRDAAVCIMHMLGRVPDLPVAMRFVTNMVQAAVDAWAREHDVISGDPGQEFGRCVADGLAEIILSLPVAMLDYCKPLLDAVDEHPDMAASFIESLVVRMDGSSGGCPFWDVWQAFVGRITEAPWRSDTVSDDSKGAALVRCMVFDMWWLKDARHWAYLAGHEGRVAEFVCRLPSTQYVLASFAHYLYLSRAGSDVGSLKAVACILRAGDPAKLLDNVDTVDYLAYVLQRYVYGMPAVLKKDAALRGDTLLILDRLADAGSSAAYAMRDDFATTNGDDTPPPPVN